MNTKELNSRISDYRPEIMKDYKERCILTVRTVEGKRLIFDSEGKQISEVIETIEQQDPDMAKRGLVKITITAWAKCE